MQLTGFKVVVVQGHKRGEEVLDHVVVQTVEEEVQRELSVAPLHLVRLCGCFTEWLFVCVAVCVVVCLCGCLSMWLFACVVFSYLSDH